MRHRLFVAGLLFTYLIVSSSAIFAQESTPEEEMTAEATAEVTIVAEPPIAEITPEPEATDEPEVTAEATETPTTEAPEASPSPAGTSYVVQPGDTLFRIARRFGVSVSAIIQANGIVNPNRILVGQSLIIPVTLVVPTAAPPTQPPPTQPPAGSTTEYIVQPGDTLFRIAVRFNTTVSQLVALNNLSSPSLIFSGTRLLIPTAGAPVQPTAAVTPTPVPPPTAEVDTAFGRGLVVFLEDQDLNALATQASQLGVSWIKFTVDWRDVQPSQDSEIDFTLVDSAVNTFNEAGFQILITLTGAPDWARPNASEYVLAATTDYGPPEDMTLFGTFAGEVAERYEGRVQAYEIWTEPNLRRTWIDPVSVGATPNSPSTERMSDARYIDMLRAAYVAIKQSDSGALVITAGLAPTGLNDRRNAIDDRLFLRELLRQGAANLSDGIGVQPDGFANPPDFRSPQQAPGVDSQFDDPRFFFLDTIEDYRRILVEEEAPGKALWATRFGWGTTEGNLIVAPILPFQNFLTYTSPLEQSQYIVRAFEIGAELGYVGPMMLYNLNGCQANDGEACYYALIDSNDRARPVFSALQGAIDAPEVQPEATEEAVSESSG